MSHNDNIHISRSGSLRRTQRTKFCSKQSDIKQIRAGNVDAIFNKIEDFRGRPTESFFCFSALGQT